LKEIKLENLDVNEVLDIVRSLRAQGLIQGKDFDFSYNKAVYQDWRDWDNTINTVSPKHAIFKFYDDRYATLFALRYGSK
jgi:hypothetical protein